MKPNSFNNKLNATEIHTNGFAESAGGTFGQTSTESFTERNARKRQVITSYRDSAVGSGRQAREGAVRLQVPQRKTGQASPDNSQPMNNRPVGHTFAEPTSRRYDPYA